METALLWARTHVVMEERAAEFSNKSGHITFFFHQGQSRQQSWIFTHFKSAIIGYKESGWKIVFSEKD